ncbi:ribokinase (plasmid) [Cellulomonas sp. WB94]|uniref:ribokinase n=1 Tax=Cellulomonas sp. WB94 TaxID=2173174 RepID=UPI000D57BF9B|nr:ribokinase [Cellulomonas sp. WB94]PVU81432.1 ribokinase [Cellulomonas sp. WB94]
MSAHKVVVVGSANADLVLDIDHRPAAGETVLGSDVVTTAGGKGANQAVAAGRLGFDVAFVGCIGADSHGELLRASLTSAGVDLDGVRVVDAPTGNAIILVTPDGENSIIVSPAANRFLTPALVDELKPVWAGASVLVAQLEIPLETIASLLPEAHRSGTRVVLNAAPAAVLPDGVLSVADPLVVNESEAAFLLARASTAPPDAAIVDPGDVAKALLALGPRSVVLTLGGAGAVLVERSRDTVGRDSARVAASQDVVHVPGHTVEVVDTTGAGDAFVGALAAHLSDGVDLEEAVRRANDVAAIAVTRRGAQESYPTREEINR